jgi:hypothetical protein
MLKLFRRIWRLLYGHHDPIVLELPRPQVTQAVRKMDAPQTPAALSEPAAPPLTSARSLELKMYEARNTPGHLDELFLLCHEASLDDVKKLLSQVTSQAERDIVEEAIENKTLLSETDEERRDRIASELGVIPDAIIEPSGPYFGRIQGDPNWTVDDHPHEDVIPQSCKPPKAPSRT